MLSDPSGHLHRLEALWNMELKGEIEVSEQQMLVTLGPR